MKVYFLLGLFILTLGASYSEILDISYPQEVILYKETTRVGINIRNLGNTTQIVLPLLQTMNRGVEMESFTSVLVPGEETEFFVNIKKPIDDGVYTLLIKVRAGEEYYTYDTLDIRVINPEHTLRVVDYYANISEDRTYLEIDVENTVSEKEITFVFMVSDLFGGREIKKGRFIDIKNKTFSFIFNLGKEQHKTERVSSFWIEYEFQNKEYASDNIQIRLGSADEYIAYVTKTGVVYDMAPDYEEYSGLNKHSPITGYTPIAADGASTLCRIYVEGSLYDNIKIFLPLDLLPSTVKEGRLIKSYDTLNFRIKNKVCVYPEKSLVTITLLVSIISVILFMGLNTVEPYELY